MKKTRLLFLIPLLALGACSEGDTSNIIGDLTSGLDSIGINFSYDNTLNEFNYEGSAVYQYLDSLAKGDGYCIKMEAIADLKYYEPDDTHQDFYVKYEISFNEKGNEAWAQVKQLDEQGALVHDYRVKAEKQDGVTFNYALMYDGDVKERGAVNLEDYNLPYDLDTIKKGLVLSGTALQFMQDSQIKKTRTTEEGRDCIKYSVDTNTEGLLNKLEVLVDIDTRILVHLTDISITNDYTQRSILKVANAENKADQASYFA